MAAVPDTPDIEETPLLAQVNLPHEVIYNRFTPARKRVIMAMVSVCGLLPRALRHSLVFKVIRSLLVTVFQCSFLGRSCPAYPRLLRTCTRMSLLQGQRLVSARDASALTFRLGKLQLGCQRVCVGFVSRRTYRFFVLGIL